MEAYHHQDPPPQHKKLVVPGSSIVNHLIHIGTKSKANKLLLASCDISTIAFYYL